MLQLTKIQHTIIMAKLVECC